MKIVKSFSFWFVFVSIFISYVHFTGQDDKGLLFFLLGLEPILVRMAYSEMFRDLIFDDLSMEILWCGYALRIATLLLYGLTLDCLLHQFRKRKMKLKGRTS